MAAHAMKKRKGSFGHGSNVYPQYTFEDVSQESSDSSDLKGKNRRGKGPIPHTHTNVQARTKAQKSLSYDSSMLKLKANELLTKVRPDYEGRMVKLESSLRRLKEVIGRIPDREAKPVCEDAFVPI